MSEEVQDEPQKEWSPEDEATAREMGWKSADDWHGPQPPQGLIENPKDWIENQRRVPAVRTLEAKLEGVQETVRKIEAVTQKQIEAMKSAHEARVADLETQRREAVASGDTETYDKITEQINSSQPPEPEPQNDIPAATRAAIDNWMVGKDWFGKDSVKTAATTAAWKEAEERGMTDPTAILAHIDTRLAVFDPKPAQPAADAMVDGGLMLGGGSKSGFASLPDDAKAAFERQWKREMFTQEKKEDAQAWYAEEYNNA